MRIRFTSSGETLMRFSYLLYEIPEAGPNAYYRKTLRHRPLFYSNRLINTSP